MAHDSPDEPEAKQSSVMVMQGGFTVRVQAPRGRKLYPSQLWKAGALILLGQWLPPGGTPRV